MSRFAAAMAIAVAVGVAPATTARAQGVDDVRLTLISQTAATTPDRPLSIHVAAVNDGPTHFQDLSLTVSASTPTGSRTEYGQALVQGSVSATATTTRSITGPLEPGATRSFRPVELALEEGAPADNALLPVTVALRADGGFTPVATLRTAVVWIIEPPQAPLNVSVSFVVDEPYERRPDGVFLDNVIERSIQPGGRLEAIAGALETVPVASTLVMSPLLLEDLSGMADGYKVLRDEDVEAVGGDDPRAQAAAGMLERLGAIARRPGTEVIALPYASPSVPAMTAAGLDADLAEHIRRGRDVVESLLGVTPSETLFRPPGSTITEESLDPLKRILSADGSTEALLLDADRLVSPTGLTLSPPGVALVGEEEGLMAVVPDGLVAQRLIELPEDPRLAAMRTLGELSALYFEQPSIDRGVSIVFGEGHPLDRALLEPLLAGLRHRPQLSWLRAQAATRVLVAETRPEDPDPVTRRVREPDSVGSFTGEFLARLAGSRDELAALVSVGASQELVDGIGTNRLIAQSRHLLDRPDLAQSYLTAVSRAVESELSKVHPPSPSTITLTSRAGDLPVTVRNDAGYPMRVSLMLSAPRLRFVGGPRRVVELEREQQTFVFPVRAQTTGRFPVNVVVETPTGKQIATSRIVIRSTAYNRVALVITIGAALFLVMWWGRRLLPRK